MYMTLAQQRPDAQPGPSPESAEAAAASGAPVPEKEGGSIVTEGDMPLAEAMPGEAEFDEKLANRVARGLVEAYLGPAAKPVTPAVRTARARARRQNTALQVARAMGRGEPLKDEE